MEVIPVINCHLKDSDCVEHKIREIEKISKWVHLDIADGKFTFNKTWNDPEEWKKFSPDLKLEAHLMVENPEEEAEKWLRAGAKRVIAHFETINEKSAKNIMALARDFGASVMLALNPETHISDLPDFFRNFAEYQILAVHPGLAGQKFLPSVLKKIGDIRKEVHSARIEVDGGINPETAKLIKKEGANVIVSGSFILKNNPPQALRELENV